ncbi:unnamed protein product [Closterium sp. NIES-53]
MHNLASNSNPFPHAIPPPTEPGQGLSKADKKKVEKLRVPDEQWDLLKDLRTFLSPFNKVSKAAEGTAYPTVSMVVPYYNGLIDAMKSHLAKGPSATLRLMIEKALATLKKYAYIDSNEQLDRHLPGAIHEGDVVRRRTLGEAASRDRAEREVAVGIQRCDRACA